MKDTRCGNIGPLGWACELEAGHEGMHSGSMIYDHECKPIDLDNKLRMVFGIDPAVGPETTVRSDGKIISKIITGAPRK